MNKERDNLVNFHREIARLMQRHSEVVPSEVRREIKGLEDLRVDLYHDRQIDALLEKLDDDEKELVLDEMISCMDGEGGELFTRLLMYFVPDKVSEDKTGKWLAFQRAFMPWLDGDE